MCRSEKCLTRRMEKLQGDIADKNDPFADKIDEEEAESNEACKDESDDKNGDITSSDEEQ